MSKKKYDDDDGRTVFDMSGVSRPSLFGRPRGEGDEKPKPEKSNPVGDEDFDTCTDNRTPAVPCDPQSNDSHDGEDEPVAPPVSMSKDERKAFVSGALAAALLIALVFIIGLGLLIFLLDMFWF